MTKSGFRSLTNRSKQILGINMINKLQAQWGKDTPAFHSKVKEAILKQ